MTPRDDDRSDGAGVATAARSVRVGRQGIYDLTGRVVGYEFLFRSVIPRQSTDDQLPAHLREAATSQVINSVLGDFGLDQIAGDLPGFVNLTRSFLVGRAAIPASPERLVLEITRSVVVDDDLLVGVESLRSRGFRVAMAGFEGRPEQLRLLPLVDYVKIDVIDDGHRLDGLVEATRAHDVTLIASRVEDELMMARCAELGFEQFQGYLLERPVVLETVTLNPHQVGCLRLMGLLSSEDASVDQIADAIALDPGLSLRVLRVVNSASAGLRRHVDSVRQATVLVGPRTLRSIVALSVLSGTVADTPHNLWSVLSRAQACASLAGTDTAFTVGLLSGVADVLGADPDRLLSSTGVSAELRAAIIDREGADGLALSAVVAHERDDVDAVEATGINVFDVSRVYLEALSRTLDIVA